MRRQSVVRIPALQCGVGGNPMPLFFFLVIIC